MTTSTLNQLLDFTDADLVDNRQGRMSERQLDRLRAMRTRLIIIGIGADLLIALAAAAMLFLGEQRDSDLLRLIGVGVTICNAALVGIFARSWLRLGSDIRDGRVASKSGTLRHTIRIVGQRVPLYILEVGDERFNVGKPIFFAFEEGKSFRLYWSPTTRILLAADAQIIE